MVKTNFLKGISETQARIFGVFSIVLIFLTVEWKFPFYFSQDDNLSSFFPVMLQGCRSLFSGVFPTWNPYQYMGAPTASIGLYSLSYPVLYLSYAFSRFILFNEYLTIECFAFIHLAGAFFACYSLFRYLNCRRFASWSAAIAVTFSGFQLVAGRSWYYMLPVPVYFPLLLKWVLQMRGQSKFENGWFIKIALSIGLWAHAGNVQMWVYGMLFLAILSVGMLFQKTITKKQFLLLIPPGLFGFLLGAPLFFLLAVEAKNRLVPKPVTFTLNSVLGMVFPAPIFYSRLSPLNYLPSAIIPTGHGAITGFFGGVFFISFLICIASLIWQRGRFLRRFEEKNIGVLVLIAALSFLLCFGDTGGLWTLSLYLPFFRLFSHPFKLIGFGAPLMVLVGLLAIKEWERNSPDRQRLANWAYVVSVLMTFWNIGHLKMAFYNFADQPYPDLPQEYRDLFQPGIEPAGRVLAVGPDRSSLREFVLGLNLQFPTVYQIPAFLGYDTTVEHSAEVEGARERALRNPISYLDYGVRWLVSEIDLPEDLKNLHPIQRATWSRFRIYELPDAKPLIFDAQQGKALNFVLRADGLDIHPRPVNKEPMEIVANFLFRPWMRATDEKGNAIEIRSDAFGRIVFFAPARCDTLKLRYSFPFYVLGPPFIFLTIFLGLLMVFKIKMFFAKVPSLL